MELQLSIELLKLSKSGHFYFGETGHFYFYFEVTRLLHIRDFMLNNKRLQIEDKENIQKVLNELIPEYKAEQEKQRAKKN